ncbi:MAG TPA: type II secretion system protein [Verrucomicrobiae bacterium]|nr:type II secretion system protein [Verrucomicrobiae bacterium]
MKPRVAHHKTAALTLVEVLVLIVVLAVLAMVVILPAYQAAGGNAKSINCVNNLKQVGLAFRIWAGDNGEKFPMQVSVANGGTMELATGTNAWINFVVMSNELATPKILYCTADKGRVAATNFQASFNNESLSYFASLDANTNSTHALLSGDANFAISSVPVKSGLLELCTNTQVTWTSARHYIQCNIVLADGSIVGGGDPNDPNLTNLLSQTGLATNRLAIP